MQTIGSDGASVTGAQIDWTYHDRVTHRLFPVPAEFRVFRVTRARGIEEVGHYIDANGNNLWGIDPHADPRNAQTIILASDRDSGG